MKIWLYWSGKFSVQRWGFMEHFILWLLFVLPDSRKELHPIRCDRGEPEPVQTPSLYHAQGDTQRHQKGGKQLHLRCRLTSLTEQHLHDLGVSQGRKVTQVFFIAGDLSQNSTHDLTCRTREKLEFRSESRDVGRNWKCKNKIPVPERVLGSPGAFWMKSGVAIGPIFSLTEWKTS